MYFGRLEVPGFCRDQLYCISNLARHDHNLLLPPRACPFTATNRRITILATTLPDAFDQAGARATLEAAGLYAYL